MNRRTGLAWVWFALAVVAPMRMTAAQLHSGVQVRLPYGLVLYKDDARSASEHRVIMRVLDTKTQLDARAYEAAAVTGGGRTQHSELQPERPVVNEGTRVVAFGVRYHRTPGEAPVDVIVVCERIMKVSTLTCNETPQSAWTRAFPGSGLHAILEHAAADPRRVQR
jgi:hypothetical protein